MADWYYRLAIVIVAGLTLVLRYSHRRLNATRYKKPKPKEEVRRDWWLVSLAILIGGTVVTQLLGIEPFPLNLGPTADTIVRTCGLVVGIAAGTGTLWPQFVRKNNWSSPMTSPERIADHQLVTRGPYKYIRHPFYSACILGVLAVELALASYLMFVLPPIVTLIVAIGVTKEERQLEAAYGDQFRAYQARSWKLIPWIF